MDSWGFSHQFHSSDVAFVKDQIGSNCWEIKSHENQAFGDINLPPLMKTSLFHPVIPVFSVDDESKTRESGLIDLKLRRIIHQKDSQISQNLNCMASKRLEQKGFCSSTPFCKVHGCNKNLSNCKDYYKRHKVCEVHSKTSKVIVNGIEQRFCQQCSRFHLLREFDDVKRSCRKRLSGHNARRRKPHVFERHGRLHLSGNEIKESAGAISSFTKPSDLHSPYQHMQESNVSLDTNLKDRNALDLQSTSGISDELLHSKSVSPCNFETDPRFINKCIIVDSVSCSESALSLLSSQTASTCNHSSRNQTSNLQSHPVVGAQGDLFKFGMMNYDDQLLHDESCTIHLLRLASQLDRVEHQQRKS